MVLRSAHLLMLVNISMTFHEDILNGFQVTERTALYSVLGITKVQRGIAKNMYIQELWLSRSAHRLMLVNVSLTFHEDILNGLQVTELQCGRHCILFSAFFTNDLIVGSPFLEKILLMAKLSRMWHPC